MLITANNVSASEDQLSTLILKVNAKSSSNAEIDLMENKLIERASWKIKSLLSIMKIKN